MWMATTQASPASGWYARSTAGSPPAPVALYLERALGYVAWFVDPALLVDAAAGAERALRFRRFCAIALDGVLVLAAALLVGRLQVSLDARDGYARSFFVGLVALHPGLLLVDHLVERSGQAGLALGLLLLALYALATQRRIAGALLLVVVLHFDPTLALQSVSASLAALLVLSSRDDRGSLSVSRALAAAAAALALAGAVWWPFRADALAIASRLSPLQVAADGTVPNFWALYAAMRDVAPALPALHSVGVTTALSTLVGLPIVLRTVALLSIASATPSDRCVVLLHASAVALLATFVFGSYSRPAAVVAFAVPLTALAARAPGFARASLVLNTLATYSLFPLAVGPMQRIVQLLLLASYIVVCNVGFARYYGPAAALSWAETLYLAMWPVLELVRFAGGTLPHNASTLYCALGLWYAFVRLYVKFVVPAAAHKAPRETAAAVPDRSAPVLRASKESEAVAVEVVKSTKESEVVAVERSRSTKSLDSEAVVVARAAKEVHSEAVTLTRTIKESEAVAVEVAKSTKESEAVAVERVKSTKSLDAEVVAVSRATKESEAVDVVNSSVDDLANLSVGGIDLERALTPPPPAADGDTTAAAIVVGAEALVVGAAASVVQDGHDGGLAAAAMPKMRGKGGRATAMDIFGPRKTASSASASKPSAADIFGLPKAVSAPVPSTGDAFDPKEAVKVLSRAPLPSGAPLLDWAVAADENTAGLKRDKKVMNHGAGKKRFEMQDTNVCLIPFVESTSAFLAIFDGHAGRNCADDCVKIMPGAFRKALPAAGTATVADAAPYFVQAYAECDAALKKYEDQGATAVTLFLWTDANGQRLLQCANVGDSSAFLCRDGQAVAISVDHKLATPSERRRVMAVPSIELVETATRIPGGLAVSRALGDHFLKSEVTGLIGEPFVSPAMAVGGGDAFAILASDGLWDIMDGQTACDLVSAQLPLLDCAAAAQMLLKAAVSDRKCCDNVTVIVVRLN